MLKRSPRVGSWGLRGSRQVELAANGSAVGNAEDPQRPFCLCAGLGLYRPEPEGQGISDPGETPDRVDDGA